MVYRPVARCVAVVALLSALAACDSAEERAQKHLERGKELIAAGDIDRGLVELRNVFVLDASNAEARMIYAEASRQLGNMADSYRAYLSVVEANPDDYVARLALAQLAVETQSWDEAERHGRVLIENAPEKDGVDVIELALDFRAAAVDGADEKFGDLTKRARELHQAKPENKLLHRLLIDGLVRIGQVSEALEIADLSIGYYPEEQDLYIARAGLLSMLGDKRAVEQHLRDMVSRFPDDRETKALLVGQLSSEGRTSEAEAFLREQLSNAEDPTPAHVTLVTFLRQVQGNDVALQELEAAISAYESNQLFRALKAGILYDQGNVEEAIALMDGVLENAEPGDDTNRFKVTKAKMLIENGARSEADRLVQEVLLEDAGHVEALKMQARSQVFSDDPEGALRSLRIALDREPTNPEALMIMSEAHARLGNHDLAQDMKAQAVEASESAPREAIIFARDLFRNERFRAAEDVLVRALRRTPGHVELLVMLGQIHIATQDWGRAEQVENTLRRLNSDFAENQARELQFQIFGRREGRERAIAYLEELIAADDGSTTATVALIRARLADGRSNEALLLAEELVSDLPNNIQAKLVLGNTHIALSNFQEAETVIRSTMERSDDPAVALQLVRVLSAQARVDDAKVALEGALAKTPEDRNLLWVKASFLEQENRIDDAIQIYEELYTQDTGSLVIANNLASLLATYRDDEESLRRAYTVGRRLRGTDIAPFQDTYGWILYRRGEFDEALEYLEPAAEVLQSDPIVQYHLAKAYEAVGRVEDARRAYADAARVAGSDDTRPQIVEARAAIETPATPTSNE